MTHYSVQNNRSSVLPALALSIMAVGSVLALSTMLRMSPPRSETPVNIAPSDVALWTPRSGAPVFEFDVPDLANAPQVYAAEQLPDGALRDTLSLGDEKHFIRLAIQRHMQSGPADFYLEMARRAADAGFALIKAGQPQMTSSRFGKLEIADISLAGPKGPLTCAGIRMGDQAPDFSISGLMCGMSLPLNPEKIACLTDRLDLKDDSDSNLIDIFTNADNVTACKTPRVNLAKLAAALPVEPVAAAKPVRLKKR